MPTTTRVASASSLAKRRAKTAMFDEPVESLTQTDELERVSAQLAALQEQFGDGVDPGWREIANDLAAALRPYTLFREQRVEDGRIVVETRVPGSTLRAARNALDRLARQVAVESYRRDGIPVPEDEQRTDAGALDPAA
jgi:hypothetical protein